MKGLWTWLTVETRAGDLLRTRLGVALVALLVVVGASLTLADDAAQCVRVLERILFGW